MILPIFIYGHPVLRKESKDIELDAEGLEDLINDMFETLACSEGIGLAAPQIGHSVRIVVIDLDPISEDLPEYKGFKRVFLNPHVIEYDEREVETMEEGCLSIPGIHEKVLRPKRIHVRYIDDTKQTHDEWVDGYLARVMQHEFDHLDGKMFIDRISPMRRQMIKGKLKNLLQGRYSCSYKTFSMAKRRA